MHCPYCGSKTIKVDSVLIYRRSGYGDVIICSRYPKCNSYVGVSKTTGKSLGTLANGPLRRARRQAHAALDPLWKTGTLPRNRTYKNLALLLRTAQEETHIAMFDEITCRKVVLLCENNFLTMGGLE